MWPVLMDLGPVKIHSYGVMVALGFLAVILLARSSRKTSPLSVQQLFDLGAACLIGGLVGGRLLYVFINMPYFLNHPLEILMIHRGGLAFFGALTGGFLAGIWAARRMRLPILETADFLIVYVPVAHALGRMGCFLNGCCWGAPLEAAWAVYFPHLAHAVHPVQLYAVAANLTLFIILGFMRSRRTFPGQILLAYGVLYGSLRFALEFFRGDSPYRVFGLFTPFQIMAAGLIILSLAVWIPFRRVRK